MAKKRTKSRTRDVSMETPLFPCMNWGGRRPGAGRKPKLRRDGSRVHAKREVRERFTWSRPLHVTVGVAQGLPSLRTKRLSSAVLGALRGGNQRDDFRVVHFVVMSNHVHLICEAAGREALARGMKGLNVRLARAVNRVLGRKGKVVADRYHLHVLRTKAEVRNAVRYVLRNAERHGARVDSADTSTPRRSVWIDPLSSCADFPFWRERDLVLSDCAPPIVRPPRSALMRLAFEHAPISLLDDIQNTRRRTTRRPLRS